MLTTGERSGHRPQTTRRGLAATVLTLLLLTGCTPPADRAAGMPPAAAGDAAPTTTPRSGTTDPPAASPVDCGADLAAVDAVITEQLAAFAGDDWDRAFALTSRRFRASGIDAGRLRQIVTSGYAEAADAEFHEVLGCVRTGREVQVLIEVTATDGATLGLVYLMTREDGRWRISGAVEHGTGASEPPNLPA
ncbi:MAG TPA: DUF4864 domain-containing protein [Euzebyales bacterium]|nr:DUF4864 domain-containing protein [Euzebyales bacterium]